MRIINAHIKNYKSLRDVEIYDIGNLTILIGKNSSDKSNFLECLFLFFNEFDAAPQRNVSGVSDLLWYNRETGNPIELTVTVKLRKREYNQIFPNDLISTLGLTFKKGELTITREISFISPNTATWRTSFVAFDGTALILDGKPVLVKVESIEFTANTTIQQTTDTILSKKIENEKQEIITKALTNISQRFKEKFNLIFAVRNNLGSIPELGERETSILPEIQNDMFELEQSEKVNDVKLWNQVERDIEAVPSLRNLRDRGDELRSKQGFIYFPLSSIGGGDQEILGLSFLLRREKAHILAFEEPETHLHPDLSRKFLKILKDVSKNKQLIVSTHSSIFIDTLTLDNAWIFQKENLETKIYKIQNEEDLRIINYELGIRPSDIFFANRILFVEGSIDKNVFRIWAKKRNIDLSSPNISVIPLRGKSKGKRHLKAWTEVTKNIPVSMYMILDKDAEKEADRLVKEDIIEPRQISILSKGSIEDYYDADILIELMKERYGEDFTEDNLKPLQSEGLMKFLRKKHRNWKNFCRAKAQIGEDVATKMQKEKIDNEIVRILDRTEEYLAF